MAGVPQRDSFPETRHSVVVAAQSNDPAQRTRAIAAIAGGYWRPVYKYVRMRWKLDPESASDLTQDFFARILERDFLDSYDPAKGRLRTFLRFCIDRLVLNRTRDQRRLKRGSGAIHVPLEFNEAERELAAARLFRVAGRLLRKRVGAKSLCSSCGAPARQAPSPGQGDAISAF